MKKKLIITNTYYQLIVAIQMKETIFKDDYVSTVITDYSNGAYDIFIRIKKLSIFDEVVFANAKELNSRTTFEKLEDCIDISFFSSNRYKVLVEDLANKYYDEIISFNFRLDIYGIYSILSNINDKIKFSRFEESFLSYNAQIPDTKRRKIIRFFRKLTGKRNITSSFHNFYCFYPENYYGKLNPVKIPVISKDDGIDELLMSVFNLKKDQLLYSEKYIFFTSVFDFEGGEPVGEFELVSNIADLVGIDNILIKTHPRDKRNLYTQNGYKVDCNSNIPWEVIQIAGDFKDKVFLTVNSASVLSGSTISKDPIKTFFMYKLCNYECNEVCRENANSINKLLNDEKMHHILRTVKIAEKLEDIL